MDCNNKNSKKLSPLQKKGAILAILNKMEVSPAYRKRVEEVLEENRLRREA
ncbi:hypothetical protein [Aquimarina celericrescens]|uniref:Uncharacterized protein n=1 Tax=Aquimarina celericrescens TaxID=1964542 RepID=A0ABW5AUN5_9FLAO|nr:hypothetical protein [Aquimarina celericrescens]